MNRWKEKQLQETTNYNTLRQWNIAHQGIIRSYILVAVVAVTPLVCARLETPKIGDDEF